MEAKQLIVPLLVLLALMGATTACASAATPIPNPTEQLATAVALIQTATAQAMPTATPTATAPQAPTHTPTPPPTSTATPTTPAGPEAEATITPTTVPLPSVEEVLRRYDEAMRPLVAKLQQAQTPPNGFPTPDAAKHQIILVPMSERLFYIQEILFPQLQLGKGDAYTRLYVTYTYTRGSGLGRGPFPARAETQEVSTEVRLIGEEGGKFYVLGEKKETGGAGSSSEEELVYRAVQKLDSLGDLGEEVEGILQTIIGYACGLDWKSAELPLSRRLAVLKWAFTSEYWADRKAAAGALGRIGPEAKEAVPALIQALRDEHAWVREAAAEALGRIGPEEGVVPAL
ncbi:MAG: HEAT repeat domain-containing protein, partial [Anaerolineae bacterium]|nr:HEAT repeat domain-containing protein [Anaerolineae bacterium]